MTDELVFPETVLKPYSEPVALDELREGAPYFSLNFLDEEMLLPMLEPVTFVGLDLAEGDNGIVYLQDLESYRSGLRFEEADGPGYGATFYRGSADRIGHIFEFEKAL